MTKSIIQMLGGGLMVAAGADIYLAPPVSPEPLRFLGIALLVVGIYLLVVGVRGIIKRQPGRS